MNSRTKKIRLFPGLASVGCGTFIPWHRDSRWCDDCPYQTKHNHSHQKVRNIFHLCRQPAWCAHSSLRGLYICLFCPKYFRPLILHSINFETAFFSKNDLDSLFHIFIILIKIMMSMAIVFFCNFLENEISDCNVVDWRHELFSNNLGVWHVYLLIYRKKEKVKEVATWRGSERPRSHTGVVLSEISDFQEKIET